MSQVLRLSERLTLLPVVHGSGDFAVRLRDELLGGGFDCVAVPIPPSFADDVIAGVEQLPAISAVVQEEPDGDACSYVPIDPCQPAIAAIRWALQERVAVEFIDLETRSYEPQATVLPDPYALKKIAIEKYAAAVLPALPRPRPGSQADERARWIAFQAHKLELDYRNVALVCGLVDWPWVREAYRERAPYPEPAPFFAPTRRHGVDERTLTFFLGELPFVTALHERARGALDPDENLSVDGIKELALVARDRWAERSEGTTNWLTPSLLQTFFQYARNLTLMERRLTPDLYTLVIAAKQIGGDRFALELLEAAREYPVDRAPTGLGELKMGLGKASLPEQGVVAMKNRLPGSAMEWRSLSLKPEPPRKAVERYRATWNPYQECSWPIEDQRIESFHTHVRDQAKALIGADLARSEKFTTSVRDGIDIRETLRNWHTGDLYVKNLPPARGGIEVVAFLFDVPADPRKYRWRTTWQAEHAQESTIGLFATDYRQDMVGPNIGRAVYGGVFFIFPPRYIPNIWDDPRIPTEGPLEDRLLAAAVTHSHERHVAVVAPCPLRASWRRLASARGKRLIQLPLSRFSARLIERLRVVHVLGDKSVRSYAAHFIRDE